MASLRREHSDFPTIETSEGPQLRFLRPQHCGVWTIETSEISTMWCLENSNVWDFNIGTVGTSEISTLYVEKRQMSSVET